MFTFLRPSAPTPRLSLSQIIDKVAAGEISLLDVREMAEVRASGKAKGAVVIPLSLLPVKADPAQGEGLLPAGKPVAVYCASGGRSGMAAQVLARLGFAEVHNIGGLGDWTAAGGQVERL